MIAASKPKISAVLAALALLVAACGGGSDSSTASESTPAPASEPTAAPAMTEPVAEPDPTATEVPPTPTEVPPTPEPTPEPTEVPPTSEPTPEPTPEATEPPVAVDPTPEATEPPVDATPVATTEDGAAAEKATAGEAVPPPAPAVDGALIFSQSCANCHAADGTGTSLGPSIIGIGQFFAADDSALVNLVTNGGTTMPAFGARLPGVEIDAVVDYVVATFQ